jgi:hypothetical protein
MAHLPPLHWDFCLNCEGALTDQQIDDDDSYCPTCIDLLVGVSE